MNVLGPSIDFQARRSSFCEVLEQAGVDAFLISSPITMSYLTGFGEGSYERILHLALHADGRMVLICPQLTATYARRAGIEDVQPWTDNDDPKVLMRSLAENWGLKSAVIAVDNEMQAAHLLIWQSILPAALFREGQTLVSGLTAVKDEAELEAMERAAKIADQAWIGIQREIGPGITEHALSFKLMNLMQDLGGKPTFAIAATGKNGAEPHHGSDNTTLESGDVVVLDFGCDLNGYQSDITRTICVGPASDEAKKVYATVYQAFLAARAAIRPGVTGQQVDRAARDVIEKAGYGEFFIHRTGHGIGMRGHEDPYIVETNSVPLVEGNCFSIEPGIYLPGRFGVRIENIVTCTSHGHHSFNNEPSPTILEL